VEVCSTVSFYWVANLFFMSTEIKNSEIKSPKSNVKAGHPDKPKKPDPKADKPKAKLHLLHSYAGTVGEYGANPDGVYDSFSLQTDGASRTVKFPPHFGQALHAAAQPGQAATVLAYVHTTPAGAEHLHLASLEVAGQVLRPLPPGDPADEAFAVQSTITELLQDPKGQLRAIWLAGEAAELRLPPHLSAQLADYLAVGASVQASGAQRADRPGELRAPGSPAPRHLKLLTVGEQSFLLD
jgi:hypothetical protein